MLISVVASLTVLGGCSNKAISNRRYLTVYKPPAVLHLKLIKSKGRDEYIKSLEQALTKLVTKVRVQRKIIEAYKKEVEDFNSEEEVK